MKPSCSFIHPQCLHELLFQSSKINLQLFWPPVLVSVPRLQTSISRSHYQAHRCLAVVSTRSTPPALSSSPILCLLLSVVDPRLCSLQLHLPTHLPLISTHVFCCASLRSVPPPAPCSHHRSQSTDSCLTSSVCPSQQAWNNDSGFQNATEKESAVIL